MCLNCWAMVWGGLVWVGKSADEGVLMGPSKVGGEEKEEDVSHCVLLEWSGADM